METGNRLDYNLKILEIIEGDATGLFIKKFSESLVDLGIVRSEDLFDYEELCRVSGKPIKNTREILEVLKEFYTTSPGMRFLQGLIINCLILDVAPYWGEESKGTFNRITHV